LGLAGTLGSNMEVFDAEMFAVKQAMQLASERITFQTEDIWIFSDSQAAIKRIARSGMGAGQAYVKGIQELAESIDTNITIHIHWVPGHMNIYGNDRADEMAKKGTEIQSSGGETITSLSFLKKKIKEESLLEWNKQWANARNKSRSYSKFECYPRWKALPMIERKQAWSTYVQLKLGHGYFKSYLVRLPGYDTDQCLECKTKQSPEHLILSCKAYREEQKIMRRTAGFKERLTLRLIMNTERGRIALFDYLKETQIATRRWLLGEAD
jgi:ribonuclease HI